jgi:hypothetical protein
MSSSFVREDHREGFDAGAERSVGKTTSNRIGWRINIPPREQRRYVLDRNPSPFGSNDLQTEIVH